MVSQGWEEGRGFGDVRRLGESLNLFIYVVSCLYCLISCS